ncbi:MAG: DUF4197 domain-containing protein [Brevinematales bacterium]|nr:DUF4197 domain-containing protein [Brevinematales bacterium]
MEKPKKAPVKKPSAQSKKNSHTEVKEPAKKKPDNPIRSIIKSALLFLAESGGYLKNKSVTIGLPPELAGWADTLRAIGFGRQIDEMMESVNRAATGAVDEAMDTIIDAMSEISIEDMGKLLFGPEDAGAKYLESKTRKKLSKQFAPIIKKTMNEIGIMKLFDKLVAAYNAIPLMPNIKFDLQAYANERALDGIYVMIAEEERKIRRDPFALMSKLMGGKS